VRTSTRRRSRIIRRLVYWYMYSVLLCAVRLYAALPQAFADGVPGRKVMYSTVYHKALYAHRQWMCLL
jgi:hypothetical protein